MLVSFNWLKEYAPFKLSPEEAGEKLTAVGLEVKGITPIYSPIKKCVVGEIVRAVKHPRADRLHCVEVNTGETKLSIVCGAGNLQRGSKVAVALRGSRLPNGQVIEEATIRGEISEGMICSKAELGVGRENEDIWILPEKAKRGKPIAAYLPDEDFLLDIDITPNRTDCMSIIGVARELATTTDQYISKKEHKTFLNKTGNIFISLKEPEACPRYTARLLENIRVTPSPDWLASRLEKYGIRPINNVVDITNYILLEYGQPLHAFSFDKVKGKKIIIRYAHRGEEIVTLDEQRIQLKQEDLVIADAEKPIALAGVMGGAETGISKDTTMILLECACFSPRGIRQTSRRHKIETDSSALFSRGTDVHEVPLAIHYATELLVQYAEGHVISSLKDIYPQKKKRIDIHFRYQCINRLLGTPIEKKTVNAIFHRLGCELQQISNDQVKVNVPSFRSDLYHEWDLVEEIARIYGYDRLKASLPAIANQTRPEAGSSEKKIQTIMTGLGYNQVINSSFVENRFLSRNNLMNASLVQLENPINADERCLRNSHLYGLLKNLKSNLERHTPHTQKIFEIGRVFSKSENLDDHGEKRHLGILGYGNVESPNWTTSASPFGFYDLSGDLSELLRKQGAKQVEFAPLEPSSLYSSAAAAKIHVEERVCGSLGKIQRSILDSMEPRLQNVYYGEIDLDLLSETLKANPSFQPYSSFPPVYRDFAVVGAKGIRGGEIASAIASFDERIHQVDISNIYEGEGIPQGKISIVFSIEYNRPDGTLHGEEVDRIESDLARQLIRQFKVQLR